MTAVSAVLLSLLLVLQGLSPTAALVREIRVVREDAIKSSAVLNRMAASRVGWPGHAGLAAACPAKIGTVKVTVCGEIKAWVTILNPFAAGRWAVRAWLASRPHRHIMLGTWRWVGVAIRRIGPYTWLVAEFAR